MSFPLRPLRYDREREREYSCCQRVKLPPHHPTEKSPHCPTTHKLQLAKNKRRQRERAARTHSMPPPLQKRQAARHTFAKNKGHYFCLPPLRDIKARNHGGRQGTRRASKHSMRDPGRGFSCTRGFGRACLANKPHTAVKVGAFALFSTQAETNAAGQCDSRGRAVGEEKRRP